MSYLEIDRGIWRHKAQNQKWSNDPQVRNQPTHNDGVGTVRLIKPSPIKPFQLLADGRCLDTFENLYSSSLITTILTSGCRLFAQDIYDQCYDHARDNGYLLWEDAKKMRLIVSGEFHQEMREFLRRQKWSKGSDHLLRREDATCLYHTILHVRKAWIYLPSRQVFRRSNCGRQSGSLIDVEIIWTRRS